MKTVLRVIGMMVVLSLIGGGLKRLTGGGSPTKVVEVGNMEVTIPDSTPHGLLAVTKALLAQTAYVPSYQACLLRQAHRLLTPTAAKEYETLPTGKQQREESAFMEKVLPHCDRPGQTIINPVGYPSNSGCAPPPWPIGGRLSRLAGLVRVPVEVGPAAARPGRGDELAVGRRRSAPPARAGGRRAARAAWRRGG